VVTGTHGRDWRVWPSGRQAKWASRSQRAGPFSLFLLLTSFPNKFQSFSFKKYKSLSYLTPKISKIVKLMDKFKTNKHPFWPNF
jgi:hypothetical protein